MEVTITERQCLIFKEIKKFYIDNDALPTSRTLRKILNNEETGYFFTNTMIISELKKLHEKGVLKKNAQKQYMFSRSRPTIIVKEGKGDKGN